MPVGGGGPENDGGSAGWNGGKFEHGNGGSRDRFRSPKRPKFCLDKLKFPSFWSFYTRFVRKYRTPTPGPASLVPVEMEEKEASSVRYTNVRTTEYRLIHNINYEVSLPVPSRHNRQYHHDPGRTNGPKHETTYLPPIRHTAPDLQRM